MEVYGVFTKRCVVELIFLLAESQDKEDGEFLVGDCVVFLTCHFVGGLGWSD